MSHLSYFRRSVVAFPLAALAALAMFVISEVSYQDATSSLDSLGERPLDDLDARRMTVASHPSDDDLRDGRDQRARKREGDRSIRGIGWDENRHRGQHGSDRVAQR